MWRARGYQKGSPNVSEVHNFDIPLLIENYVDGLCINYGTIHVNTYVAMELLTTEVVVLISHVLYSHGQSIPYLLAIIITVTLEQGMLLMIMYTTFLT